MRASNYQDWAAAGFKDYGDFADMVTFCNQSEYGDGQLEGDWFYGDDDERVIYSGSFGNYNAPGSSSDTFAERYETEDEYRAALAEWEAYPEYLDSDE